MTYVRERGEKILPGCYYPGCNADHAPGVKFCSKHGGKDMSEKVEKKAPTKKASKPKAKKATPKKVTTKPKKKGNVKGHKKGPMSKQHKQAIKDALAKARSHQRIQWNDVLDAFKKSDETEELYEMGSQVSASATAVRLKDRPQSHGLFIWTEGPSVVISKEPRNAVV